MNKKILTGTLAGILSAGMVSPVLASEKAGVNEVYKVAYDATIKAKNDKTQKSVNEARIAVKNFKALANTEGLNNMASTLSVILDEVQQPILSTAVKGALNAQKVRSQVSVNNAYEVLPTELKDLEGTSDRDYWKRQYSSYKTAIDEVQQELQSKAFTATKKAESSRSAADVVTARVLVKEVQTSTVKAVANWATTLLQRVDNIVVADDIHQVVKAVKSATNVRELANVLESNPNLFIGYTDENLDEYMSAKTRFLNDIVTVGDVQSLVIDAGNLDVKNERLVAGIVKANNTVEMTRLMREAGITRVNDQWGADYNTVILNSGMTKISEIQAKVNLVNIGKVKAAYDNAWEKTTNEGAIKAALDLNQAYYPEITSKQKEQKESYKKHLNIQLDLAAVVKATTVSAYNSAVDKLDSSSNNFSKSIINKYLVERYMAADNAVVSVDGLNRAIKAETENVITLAAKNVYKVAKENSGLTQEQFNNDANAKKALDMAFEHLRKATDIETTYKFDVEVNYEYYHGYVQIIAFDSELGSKDITIENVNTIEELIRTINNHAIFEKLNALTDAKTYDEAFRIINTVAKETKVKNVIEANKAYYFNNKDLFVGIKASGDLQWRVDVTNAIAGIANRNSASEVSGSLLEYANLTGNATIKNVGVEGRKDFADLIMEGNYSLGTVKELETSIDTLTAVRQGVLADVNKSLKEIYAFETGQQNSVPYTAYETLANALNKVPGISGVDVVKAEDLYRNSIKKDNSGTVIYGNFSTIRAALY